MSVDIATLGRCVVWFSAGAASTVAAKLALVDRPDALICYIDTGSEHEDTPRYLADVSAWLGRPITVLRSFLDELDPDRGDYEAEEEVECGVLCAGAEASWAVENCDV